jgi:predicted transcriptional regulator
MGRPSHKPDPTSRRQVEALSGYGIPEPEIAGLIGIDPKTLRKHYRHELDHGHTKANAKVAENLYRKATGEGREAVIAAIFWLKTRARWKETVVNEVAIRHEDALLMLE